MYDHLALTLFATGDDFEFDGVRAILRKLFTMLKLPSSREFPATERALGESEGTSSPEGRRSC